MIQLLQNHFIKTAWRNLWKQRTIRFVNIVGLAIGMSAAFLVLLWVQNQFSTDGFQPDANREYLLTWMDKNHTIVADGSPFPITTEAMGRISGIEGITSYYPHGPAPQIIHIAARIQTEKNFVFADRNWFQFFHYNFLAGGGQDFGRKNGIILTASLAKRYFGSGAAVGRTIMMDSIDYNILGVIEDNPANSSFQFDLFLPLQSYFTDPSRAQARTNWGGFSAKTFG
jgi:putative ABC transport system permease protein